MIKKIKLVGYTLLCILLLLPTVNVYASDDNYDQWKKTALVEPNRGQLVAAGPVEIKWKKLSLEKSQVKNYIIYIDSEKIETIADDSQDIKSTHVYLTSVTSHTIRIVAVLENNQRINSSIRTFYLSKKGMGTSMAKEVQLGASWYYNWSAIPDSDVSKSLEFVPMIWGNYAEAHEPLKTLPKQGYHTVLGYNEPDFREQSNVDVQTAIENQHYFTETGLRVGSPATFEWGSRSSWLNTYMQEVGDQVDFVPIHAYIGYAEDYETAAVGFLKMVEQTYKDYEKPIWITEFAIANWDWHQYDGKYKKANEKVYKFMELVINGDSSKGIVGLDAMPFVERYAWFPFDATDVAGGASGLYYTQVDCERDRSLKYGHLTQLGKLYRSLGNPYEFKNGTIDLSLIPEDEYVKDVSFNASKVYVKFGTYETQEIEVGSLLEKPKAPREKGYTFVGWYTDKQGKNALDFNKPIYKNQAFYAKFTRHLTKEPTNDNQVMNVSMGSQTFFLKKNGFIKVMTPQKNGYTFKGWYSDKEGIIKFDFSQTVKQDLVLYAKWQENKTGKNEVTLTTNSPQTTQLIYKRMHNHDLIYITIFCGSAIMLSLVVIYCVMRKRN